MVTKKRTYQLSLSECRGKPVLRRILPNALLNPRSGSTPTSNPPPRLCTRLQEPPNLPPRPRLLHPPHRGRRSARLPYESIASASAKEIPLFEPKGGDSAF